MLTRLFSTRKRFVPVEMVVAEPDVSEGIPADDDGEGLFFGEAQKRMLDEAIAYLEGRTIGDALIACESAAAIRVFIPSVYAGRGYDELYDDDGAFVSVFIGIPDDALLPGIQGGACRVSRGWIEAGGHAGYDALYDKTVIVA